MATIATKLRRGMAIKVKGESGLLLEVEHRSPGKGAGFVQVIMRSFSSGKSKDMRFAASDKAEVVKTDRQKLEYSYTDGSAYFFMNPETYETVEVPNELVGDARDYLTENLPVEILYVENEPVSIDLPPSIDMKVTNAPEGLKGDTANNPTKSVTLETGISIQAPLFIRTGEVIKIDPNTGKYLGRSN